MLTSWLIIAAIENDTNWIEIAGKNVDRREGVIYLQKKWAGHILSVALGVLVPKQLGIRFRCINQQKNAFNPVMF